MARLPTRRFLIDLDVGQASYGQKLVTGGSGPALEIYPRLPGAKSHIKALREKLKGKAI